MTKCLSDLGAIFMVFAAGVCADAQDGPALSPDQARTADRLIDEALEDDVA